MVRVLVFGTFDGLHEGHLDFLRQAKKCGDYLVVVVGRDSTVERVKRRLPKFTEAERLAAVEQVPEVDFARLGNEGVSPYEVIKEVKPDVICLGYDQTHFTEKLEEKIKEFGLKIEVKRLQPYKPEVYKSSLLNTPD